MKVRIILINILIAVTLISCNKNNTQYSSLDEDITLNTVKVKHSTMTEHTYVKISQKDGRFWDNTYPNIIGIPTSLNEIKVYYKSLDNHQSLFQAYKAKKISKKNFDNYYNWWDVDSTLCTSDMIKNYTIIVTGIDSKQKKHYIIDSNNNYDISDDTIYPLDSNYQKREPHKIIYEAYNSKYDKIKTDSTWISFLIDKKGCWVQFCEHRQTSFMFDSLTYNITLYPSRGIDVKYNNSSFFYIKEDRDTTKLLQNQYLKLGESYYKVSSSADGTRVNLKKTRNALKIGSTQIGLPPIAFSAVTLNGDSILFPNDFKGKYTLLDFWALGCSPCIYEMKKYYKTLYNDYQDIFEIVGVANNKPKSLKKFTKNNAINWITIPSKDAEEISNLYNVFQYPTLYLIDPSGNIIASGNDLRNGGIEKYLIRSE